MFIFLFLPPDFGTGISSELFDLQKWFSYQNSQNFIRETARLFSKRSVRNIIVKCFKKQNFSKGWAEGLVITLCINLGYGWYLDLNKLNRLLVNPAELIWRGLCPLVRSFLKGAFQKWLEFFFWPCQGLLAMPQYV